MLYDPKWEVAPDVKKDEPWRQVLRKAAKIIEKRGWIQKKLVDDEGRVCAVGALTCVAKEDFISRGTATTKLIEHLNAGKGMNLIGIPYWNDQPGRTKQEVIATLLEVANK